MQFYEQPPRYTDFYKKCKRLTKEYPCIKLFTIGKSVLGRKIYAIGIGNLKNAVLFTGSTHGSEWLTTSLLLLFAENLSKKVCQGERFMETDVCSLLCKNGVIIVPMLNPDGVEIALGGAQTARHRENAVASMLQNAQGVWQANANGVDLNHNFDAGWHLLKQMEIDQGITCPRETRFGGNAPNSEPETRAIVKATIAFSPKIVVAFHSQGEEIFYAYGDNTPALSALIATEMSHLCGYKLVSNDGLYSHGGYKDWFIHKFARPGFTIEIGKGKNPLPISELMPIYSRLCGVMLAFVQI
ncbi:MAG: M14 family metallocarboxypeptidase [Oscillospiraceae bacterium]|nr:M14 family metallocarboxypeptidase [Oscillospiraceae bacterium]